MDFLKTRHYGALRVPPRLAPVPRLPMFAELIYCWSKFTVLAFIYPNMSQSFFGLILADVPPGVGVGGVGVCWVGHHPDVQRAL